MKRKLLYLFLALIFAVSTVILSACSDKGGNEGTDSGHMHSLVHHVPIAATCETEGNIEYWSCAGCGKYFSDENAVNEIETTVIPATGHSWGEWETIYSVSCTYDGLESRTCSICSAYETRSVTATGHDYSGGWKFDEQTHWQQCKNCNGKKDIASHSFSGDSCAVCGYTITYTDNLDYELSNDGSYYIVSGRGSADDSFVFIPAQFDGKPVKGIGVSAFENDAALTGIYLPESVECISDYAFYGCSNLVSVKMQDGLQTIGLQAFKNCEALQDIEISSKLNAIGQRAFENCGVSNIYVRDLAAWCAIQFDGEDANPLSNAYNFYLNGEAVKDLVIPDTVTVIADYAFYRADNLISVEIGDSVTTIGEFAFSGSSLTSITIPEDVTTIGEFAFQSCASLKSITILDGVTTIGGSAFADCTLLTSITIPDSVTIIGDSAFSGCNSLTGITIPDSVTTIGDSAFWNCSSLRSITIPEGVTTIGDSAFSGCTSLTSITIPDSVTIISDSAFGGCSSLTSITIPDSVTDIGTYAFSDCSSLTSITIPDSVTDIGISAFSRCTSLRSITIPDSITDIAWNVFQDCTSLTNITIPDSVTIISDSAFEGCTSLTSITIPESVTDIAGSAFAGCSSLKEAYFADPYNWRKGHFPEEIIPAEQLSDPQIAAELLTKNDSGLYK